MPVLLDIAPGIPPVSRQATGRQIYQRFEAEPDTLAIAVVDDENRPIGIIERNAFLVRMAAQYGRALWSGREVTQMMKTDPMMADVAVTVADFCGRVLQESPSDLMHGFIVTRDGRYAGVGTAMALLQASAAAMADHARDMTRLADEASAASLRAHDALEARARFLAVMSHEIRTPLNGVLAVAEIIRRKLTQKDLQPLVGTILESGGVLLRLLNDALDLARAEAAGLDLDDQPLAVAGLLDQVKVFWAPQAELKSVSLAATYDGPADVHVLGDRIRLRQIFDNLVGNALKFATQGVAVRLQVREEAGQVILTGEVTDDGPGVPPDRLESIFEPFQQTEDGVRRGGAGLGLAVCRQITERMGGTITAANRLTGGAVFRFEVTLPHAMADEARFSDDSDGAPADRALHILIADDNPTNRLVATSLCEIFGCTSEAVDDGAAAARAVATGRFDLVLMDIKMPVMDGIEATRRIRSGTGATSTIPVVALTANADPADAAFYRSCGMNGVVEKPIRPERLLAAIRAVSQLDDGFQVIELAQATAA